MKVRDKRRLPFVQIEKAIVVAHDLSHAAFRVYCALVVRANEDGRCWPSVRRLAADIGMSKSTAMDALAALEQQKLITVEHADDADANHNVYTIVDREFRPGVRSEYRGVRSEYPNENTLNEKEDSLSPLRAREDDSDSLTDGQRAYAVSQGCTDPTDCFDGYAVHFSGKLRPQRSFRRFQKWARDAHGGPSWKACRCQTRNGQQQQRAAPVAPGLSGVQAVARRMAAAGEL